MADSLVIGAGIELLGGGVVSTNPACAGAIFRLGKDFDLSAPQMTSEHVSGLLFAGEQVTGFRASNRTPRIPVVITVPSTGDIAADRLTLSGARELLLQSTAVDRWQLVWTRDGGLPLIFDCQGLSAITINHSLIYHRSLVSLVEITFEASPYGRSDDAELVVFPSPSQIWDQPPAPALIDGMTTPSNFLTGDNATFDATAGTWTNTGNSVTSRVTTPTHTGAGALQLSSIAAGNMDIGHCLAANVPDGQGTTGQGLKCLPGDTVNCKAWIRTQSLARTCQVGAYFYDSTGTLLASQPQLGTGSADSTTYVQYTASITAPVGAAYARLAVRVQSTAAANELHYVDDAWIDRGAVYSADDGLTWSLSTVTAVSGQNSARWSRVPADSPIYDHTLAAPVDITGRAKFTFWLGLATTVSGYANWHKGTATVSVILFDAQGDQCTFGVRQVKVAASALLAKPHWQLVSAHIPQDVPNFDYTTVSRYSVQVWSHWDKTVPQPSLRASAYLCSVSAAATATGSPVTRGTWYTLPGIIGSARAPLAVQLQPGMSSFSTVVEFAVAGTQNWTCPGGVTKVDKVECWGAGGGGAGSNGTNAGGGGGGGGAYAMKRNVPVTATTVYHPQVGAAGTAGTSANPGGAGADSWFTGDSSNTTRANGGRGGWAGTTTWGGSKGGAETADADLSYAGGSGRQSNVNGADNGRGGGGGGSAGTGAPGQHASGRPGADPVTGGGPGGDGGQVTGSPNTGQSPPTGPGGGGGGGGFTGSNHAGAAGFAGKVRLTYGASGILPLGSAVVHMPGRDADPRLSPLCPVGAGADTPNGGTDYTVPPVGTLVGRFDGSYSVYLINSTWNTPANSRTITVTVKQFPYSGGTATTQAIVRTVTPSTDVVNGYVEMGVVTLPLAEISPGNSDSYFAVSVNDTNTSDRFYDVLFLDTQGQTVLLNLTGAAFAQNVWIDVADLDRDLGGVFVSDTDRDRARSALVYADPASTRISGGPLTVLPGAHNRMLVYSQQGNPALSVSYFPRWWQDRLS